ncbi:LytTR family transcriptional regulator DNA-binding domain-containing protein [Chengkuizengella marina]|uniref:HTH LytTR-type domain-containing protein n=1 Tax=Chengkuizengella marina TaxID=2507566 RepID=A0A6N9Q071_9BACL|nr:LytTR family transcriptional regulator DNA-binding domain-containing protein [Chengkuizengella marina]NBI28657.1 hypothetical protein [Chengkuizengella marina]
MTIVDFLINIPLWDAKNNKTKVVNLSDIKDWTSIGRKIHIVTNDNDVLEFPVNITELGMCLKSLNHIQVDRNYVVNKRKLIDYKKHPDTIYLEDGTSRIIPDSRAKEHGLNQIELPISPDGDELLLSSLLDYITNIINSKHIDDKTRKKLQDIIEILEKKHPDT